MFRANQPQDSQLDPGFRGDGHGRLMSVRKNRILKLDNFALGRARVLRCPLKDWIYDPSLLNFSCAVLDHARAPSLESCELIWSSVNLLFLD